MKESDIPSLSLLIGPATHPVIEGGGETVSVARPPARPACLPGNTVLVRYRCMTNMTCRVGRISRAGDSITYKPGAKKVAKRYRESPKHGHGSRRRTYCTYHVL